MTHICCTEQALNYTKDICSQNKFIQTEYSKIVCCTSEINLTDEGCG